MLPDLLTSNIGLIWTRVSKSYTTTTQNIVSGFRKLLNAFENYVSRPTQFKRWTTSVTRFVRPITLVPLPNWITPILRFVFKMSFRIQLPMRTLTVNFLRKLILLFTKPQRSYFKMLLSVHILVNSNSFFRIATIAIHLFNCNVRRGHFRGRCISHTQSRIIVQRRPHPRSTNATTVRGLSHRG